MPRKRDPDLQPPTKADETIRVRISTSMKEQLLKALEDEPDFGGNYSKFFLECARAAIFHHRRGERIGIPVEFVRAKKK